MVFPFYFYFLNLYYVKIPMHINWSPRVFSLPSLPTYPFIILGYWAVYSLALGHCLLESEQPTFWKFQQQQNWAEVISVKFWKITHSEWQQTVLNFGRPPCKRTWLEPLFSRLLGTKSHRERMCSACKGRDKSYSSESECTGWTMDILTLPPGI